MPSMGTVTVAGPPLLAGVAVLEHERRRRAQARERQLDAVLVPGDPDRPARPARVADEPPVDRHHARRVAVGQKEPGVDGGDRLVTLGDARDRFDAHDLVVRERRLQVDALWVEPKDPDRDRAGRIDKGRALEVIQKHAGRDAAGFGKIGCLRPEGGEREEEQDERAREQPRPAARAGAQACAYSTQEAFLPSPLTLPARSSFLPISTRKMLLRVSISSPGGA